MAIGLRAAAMSVLGIVAVTTAGVAIRLSPVKEPQPARSESAIGTSPTPAPEPTVTMPRVKWTLGWSDEFNGRGAPTGWTADSGNGTNGWSRRVLQYYR